MKLLRQLLQTSSNVNFDDTTPAVDKYTTCKPTGVALEGVENIVSTGPDYIPVKATKKKPKQKTSDRAERSLINTLWFYGNTDAS